MSENTPSTETQSLQQSCGSTASNASVDVKLCDRCHGHGNEECWYCRGAGFVAADSEYIDVCSRCMGDGQVPDLEPDAVEVHKLCPDCFGEGVVRR